MQHLKVLEEAELVMPVRKGRERWNHLNAAAHPATSTNAGSGRTRQIRPRGWQSSSGRLRTRASGQLGLALDLVGQGSVLEG